VKYKEWIPFIGTLFFFAGTGAVIELTMLSRSCYYLQLPVPHC
jgi:hypothetical protein